MSWNPGMIQQNNEDNDGCNANIYEELCEKTYESENGPVDNVNHPFHYIHKGIETIDVIDAWTENLTGMEAVCTANVIKYISRWNDKNGVEDLKKAKWYLERLIEFIEE